MYTFSELEGDRVKLVPLTLEHAASLLVSASEPEIWRSYPRPISTIDEMEHFIQLALDGRERGEQFPFAVYDKDSGEFVGSTRFHRISERDNNLSVGFTWYNPKVWRTRVNTETKYLMLRHAFDTLKAFRIEIITTIDNERSQQAIERLGAVREGILRKKYRNTDYVFFSITDEDWPDVKARLETFLQH